MDDGEDDARRPFDVDEENIRIVLIGRTGSGKSSTGNTIMQTGYFKSDLSCSSVTESCEKGTTEILQRDKKITVHLVDTPGFFDTDLSNEKVKLEILKCFAMLEPGPHAILYVLELKRFSDEEVESIEHFLEVFGGNPYKYTTIVFTGGDALKLHNLKPEDFLRKMPNSFHEFMSKCDDRVVFLNNVAEEDIALQRKNLFVVLDKMIMKNEYSFYSNEILEELKGDILKSILANLDNYQTGTTLFVYIKIAGYCMLFVGAGFLLYDIRFIGSLLLGLGGILANTKTEKAETKAAKVMQRLRKKTSPCCII